MENLSQKNAVVCNVSLGLQGAGLYWSSRIPDWIQQGIVTSVPLH